mgnify:CR=1 FL=1
MSKSHHEDFYASFGFLTDMSLAILVEGHRVYPEAPSYTMRGGIWAPSSAGYLIRVRVRMASAGQVSPWLQLIDRIWKRSPMTSTILGNVA